MAASVSFGVVTNFTKQPNPLAHSPTCLRCNPTFHRLVRSYHTFEQLKQYSVNPGDILISCVGTFGKIAVVPDAVHPGIINPRLIRLRCFSKALPEYLSTLLRSIVVYEQFSYLSRGGTMDTINIGILADIVVPLPPIKEQHLLISFIVSETAKIDALIEKAKQSIALMQERRAALISAAVTGKIDVRAAGAGA